METTLDTTLELLDRARGAPGLAVLAACAALEYLFPPFPGDTVTLFGAFLAARRGWSAAAVLVATVAGSAAGAMLDYQIGRWLGALRPGTRRGERVRARIEPILEAFRRHGEAYLAINRFLPGVRALVFVAAGMARLRPGRVLAWATVSATAWNLVLLGAGYAAGANWDRLRAGLHLYGHVAWATLGLAALVLALRAAARRRRRPPPGQ